MFPNAEFTPIPPHLHWRYLPIPGGTELKGWLIGPLVPVVVHFKGTTRPCRAAPTRGRLACEYCAKKCSVRVVGYQPFYTSERERVVVMCSAGVGPGLKGFPHGSPVRIYRSEVPCSPIKVTSLLGDTISAHTTANIARWVPQDIKPWLLHLWKDDKLTRFLKREDPKVMMPKLIEPPEPASGLMLGAAAPAPNNGGTASTSLTKPRRKRAKAG